MSVITIDQAIAGASNVLIAVLAARVLGVASFGLFGIVFLVYVMVQGVSRALVCDPLLVHTTEAKEKPGDAIGTSCMLGVGLTAVVLLGSFGARMWHPELGDALIVLAVFVPLLILQDLGRYLGFATQRPSSAVVLDVTWLVLLIGAIPVLLITDARTLTWFIVAWAGSGALAGLLMLWQQRGARIRLDLSWLRHTWMFSWRYLVSYTSAQGAALAGSTAVGGIVSTRALGAVQGTILLARPFGTIQAAAVAAGVAGISRSTDDGAQVRRRGVKITTLTTAIAVVNAVVMLILPTGLGELVLGATWKATKPLLLPTGVQIVCLGLITGARAGLLGMRAVRKTVVIDVASTVVVLSATVAGALINGVLGALWAVAFAQGLAAVAWWMVFWTYAGHFAPAAPDVRQPDLIEADPPSPPVLNLPAALPPMA
ncbi:MAG: hypothetical protein QOC66_3405 [Pseudonocardiales bacterium]|jgi:O-antigen/teichoic acid export membrane protein|nr:hypothetical protein [Pseudonocardiales bacterium]